MILSLLIIVNLDDEDMNDDQDEIKLSSKRKSHLTISEHERFTEEKVRFQKKYQERIEQVQSISFSHHLILSPF